VTKKSSLLREDKRRWFVVMNSKLEYFCGMMYGGELVWCNDYSEAKPLDDVAKFVTIRSMTPTNIELIYEYVD